MKILHISLGLPPYRTGGLTKYSLDLMKVQVEKRDEVYLLYPGHCGLFNSAVNITYNGEEYGIKVYELINPLPVPLVSGIAEPALFYKSVDKSSFQRFLNEVGPDIIHIHTLMGIPLEFFEAARDNGIKMIFTTHDYYGLCPKANLLDFNGDFCSDTMHGSKCILCNRTGYSLKKIWIMQSGPYRLVKSKSSRLFSLVRSAENITSRIFENAGCTGGQQIQAFAANPGRNGLHFHKLIREGIFSPVLKFLGPKLNCRGAHCVSAGSPEEASALRGNVNLSQACEYVRLRDYYFKIYRLMDGFHFNSSVSREVYRRFFNAKGKVIPITHADIRSNKVKKSYRDTEDLNMVYIGPNSPMKGFPMLKDCLDQLLEEGVNGWHLTIYGCGRDKSANHYTFLQRYKYDELKKIFGSAHVIIIPSLWKETFGFIGLEALSFGVPIVLSENVGFKDLLKNGITGLFYDGSRQELYKVLKSIIQDRNILRNIHNNIIGRGFSHDLNDHYRKVKDFYYNLLMEDYVIG